MADAGNPQRGKHDAVLDFMTQAHEGNAAALLDTVLFFLSKKSDFCFEANKPEETLLGVLNGVMGKGAAAPVAAAAPAPKEAPAPAPVVDGDGYVALPVVLSSSGKAALEKAARKAAAADEAKAEGADDSAEVTTGTKCKHRGCEVAFEGGHIKYNECLYHPGEPVFHEGYKYWSCCKVQKTTEFADFMNFKGCTKGACVFTEDESTKKEKAKCRNDFYQYGKTVTLSIFAKLAQPELCEFKATKDTLFISLTFGPNGTKTCMMEVHLAGPIDPTKSKVEIMAPKAEITLFKADGSQWPNIGEVLEHVGEAPNDPTMK